MAKRGKKYRAALEKIDLLKAYTWKEASELIKKIAFAKFDETISVAAKLHLKKSHSIRDTVVFPHQFSGEKKILVFAKGEKAKEARDNGAAYVGDDDLIEKIKGGWMDFDVAIATPDMMKDVGKLGASLGRRGLMPNPKTRTVTNDIKEAISELQKGRVEFRADKTGVVNIAIGKVSMSPDKIQENMITFFDELRRKKPSDLKGDYIVSVNISATMSPRIKVNFKEAE